MKKLAEFIASVLFFPCLIVGFLYEAGSAGFTCGREIFSEAFDKAKP